MAYGHSSGLPPWEAPVMIAVKHKLFFSFKMTYQQKKALGKMPCAAEP